MTSFPDQPDHFCPGCGAERQFVGRYPWHFCNDCRDLAVDGENRPLDFGNVSMSGGFVWFYRDEPDLTDPDALQALCLIRGRPVLVHEARFGGIVAEPLPGLAIPGLATHGQTVDLRGGPGLQAARQRLRKQ